MLPQAIAGIGRRMRYTFSQEYKCCPLDGNEHLNLTYVEAAGCDLDEMLETCQISIEDWHGNVCCENWTLGDLPDSTIEMITQDIASHIQDARDNERERRAENMALVNDLNAANGWSR